MKSYFGKQVIERPRSGSSSASRKARSFGRIIHTEDGPEYFGETKLPMNMNGRAYGWDSKNFTDVLGPLKNYLRSACGRPWDDVFSEISKVLGNAGYALGHIIKDHLNVATNTWRGESGQIYYEHNGTQTVGGYRGDFYVDPWTGILCEAPHGPSWHASRPTYRKRHEAPPEIPTIAINDAAEYARIKGVWYYTEFVWDEKSIPHHVKYRNYERNWVEIQKTKRYTVKRQLGKKELRDLGIRRVGASNS